jgi:ABC-type transport system substrate-binding protein
MPAKHAKIRSMFVALVLTVLVFTASPSIGMGLIPTGGSPSVGLSANEISVSASAPLAPLNDILLDEIYQPLIPIAGEIPVGRLEDAGTGSMHVILSNGILWGDNPDRIVTPEDIIACLEERASERWDARWALRGISGIDTPETGVEGLAVFDDRTIEFQIRDGFNANIFGRALKSGALRLSWLSENITPDGTGAFRIEPASTEASELHLTRVLTHYAGRPYLDGLSAIGYASADDSVLDFGRGYLNALLLSSNERNRYVESSRAVSSRIEKIGTALIVVFFNPLRLPDSNERNALAMALDSGSVAEVVLGEGAVVTGDFEGAPSATADWASNIDDARNLYESITNPRENLTVLVADDPAARATAGRIRANWESFGVPVELVNDSGELSLSVDADVFLLSMRIPEGGEGVLPQVLALVDRNGWWEFMRLAMPPENAGLVRNVRNLAPEADLPALGSALISSGLVIPVARYDMLMAPGPGLSLVPQSVYPGTVFWRAFLGSLPAPVVESGD